jgi:hypothetical protein
MMVLYITWAINIQHYAGIIAADSRDSTGVALHYRAGTLIALCVTSVIGIGFGVGW